jgi:hypothetical protein
MHSRDSGGAHRRCALAPLHRDRARRGFRFVGLPTEVRQPIPRTKTKYAKSGGVNIAYQVVGDGPVDLMMLPDHEAIAETVEEFLTGGRYARKAGPLATVLLIDVADSTGRANEPGGGAWRSLLERYQALVRREVSRFRGREAAGDRCVATFDGPIRALRCALRLRAVLGESRLEIRASVHTGECELQNDRLSGTTVRIAAQILAKAAPGEIWCRVPRRIWYPARESSLRLEDYTS